VDDWIDQFARALSEEPLSPGEAGAMLKLAREVAHGVERKLAPLSTYLAGVHAGRVAATGGNRADAARQAAATAADITPPPGPSTDRPDTE
jgi:hypothetical protein